MSAARPRGNWIITLTMAGLAVGYLFLFCLPGQQAIREAAAEVKKQTETVEQEANLLVILQTAQEEAERADRFIAAWEQDCPPIDDLSKLYGEVYALAEQAGVTTTRFNPQPVVAGGRITKVPLKMGCQGRFRDVFTFLASLESRPYEVWIPEVHFQRTAEDGRSVSCELSLTIFASNSKNSGYAEQPN